MTRFGTSLLELLTALVVLGLSGLITVPMVLSTGRVASRATTALTADRTTASLAALLRHDLRLATTNEITPATPTMLWLARPIGEGPVCASTATTLRIRTSAWQGERLPAEGRDVVQYLTLQPSLGWHSAVIAAVSSGTCPDGQPAMQILVGSDPAGSGHVRVVEPARITTYASGGSLWLGLAGPSDPIQPFAGPVATGGFTLSHVGGALQATITPALGRSSSLRFFAAAP